MKRIYLVSITIVALMVACQKEATQAIKPTANANGVTTTSTIKGVSVTKDGNPYPNIQAISGLAGDDIGWFLNLGTVQSGYSNTPKGPVVSNLGDAGMYCGGINTVTMYAGQNIIMGTMSYANDATNLYVTYTVDPDWYMAETHLYVGSLAAAPKSGGGTPSPGRFPIKSTFTAANLSQDITYTIPLSSFLNSGFTIAAHASVLRVDTDGDVIAKETAWAAGTRFTSSKNWATYVIGTMGTCGGGGEGDLTKNQSNNN